MMTKVKSIPHMPQIHNMTAVKVKSGLYPHRGTILLCDSLAHSITARLFYKNSNSKTEVSYLASESFRRLPSHFTGDGQSWVTAMVDNRLERNLVTRSGITPSMLCCNTNNSKISGSFGGKIVSKGLTTV